ncbi:MAG: GNAT family N-acetyltransferase [Actinomycetota bacterium]|nr:GNAT family N-acetyltransferase [Actinomycetota bacterium]
MVEVAWLGATDIDRIMDLEQQAFEPSMQADRKTVLQRFSLGHHMVGAPHDDRLVGSIAFSAARLGDDPVVGLPSTFKEYSCQPVPPDPDTLCIYSLGIEPSARGLGVTRTLIHAAFAWGRAQRLPRVIADGPLPSLAGNEQVAPRPATRRMIDRYVATGEMPADDELLQDPVLNLYRRLTGCRFKALLRDFIPADTASEGWRVLLYLDL